MAVNLKTFRSILRKFKWLCDSSKIPGEFQVIDIFAYVADMTFLNSLTPPVIIHTKTAILLHDIVITDGEDKLKCFLALPLSDLVQKDILKVGDYIQINSVKLCYLEGEYGDQHIVTYVLLEDIEVLTRAVVTLPDLTRLRFLESNNARETELIPLVTSRRHYLYVWFPMCAYGPMWTDATPVTFTANDPVPHTFQTLEDLNRNDWRRLPKPYPPLLLRVLYRGLMHYYGHNLINRSLPFIGHLLVADRTGFTIALCFDKSNPGTYYNSFPGTVVLIEAYALKDTREGPSPSSVGSLRNLVEFKTHVVVNSSSRIRIIPDDCNVFAQEISLLPPVEYTFVERASLAFVAEKALVDVVGLITHVGRFERFQYKFDNLNCCYNIQVIDNSSHLPIRITIFVDKKGFDHATIHPGQILVATQLKVFRVPSDIISDQQAAIYLRTSVYTELSVDHQDKPYHRHPTVLKICNLIRDHSEEITFIKDNVLRIGGAFCFPPLPVDLESFKKSLKKRIYSLRLQPGAAWNKIFENIRYRESNSFDVGGFIVQVEFVDMQTVNSDGPAYGWSYCHNVKSRRTLFLNIKLANKLKNLQQPTNMGYSDMNFFPQKYSSEQKEELLSSRDFPPVNAENWKPGTGNVTQSIPFQGDGYYLITIVSLHYQNLFQCMLIPEPSMAPHPSFLELLSGKYELAPVRRVRTFISEPPRYTWNEVKQVQRTVSEAANKTFVFALAAFCPTMGKYEVHLRRGYLCPPDHVAEIMQADTFV